MSTLAVYDSLASFYADPARWRSGERDVGLRWRAAGGATYRAAWVRDTEELYCVRHARPGSWAAPVEVLSCVPAAELDRALAGWQEVCGEQGSYEWLCLRAVELAASGRRATASKRGSARERSRLYLPGARVSAGRARAGRGGRRRPAGVPTSS